MSDAWLFLGSFFTGLIGLILAIITNRNAATKDAMALLSKRITEVEEENKKLKDELTATKIILAQKEADIQRLTKENAELREELESLRNQFKRRSRNDNTR